MKSGDLIRCTHIEYDKNRQNYECVHFSYFAILISNILATADWLNNIDHMRVSGLEP